jgi:hypothetical protein
MTPAVVVDGSARPGRRPDQHGSGEAAVGAPETDAREDRRRQEERWQRRRALERRLHDGAALRISSLALRLGVLDRDTGAVDPDQDTRHRDIVALQDEVAAALEELRAVAGAIYPPLLHEAGLGPALRELVTARERNVVLDVAADRAEPAVEGAVYFALADCLEASGAPLAIRIRREPGSGTVEGGDTVVVIIEGADPDLGPAVLDEAGPLGGSVDVEGEPGSAGTITARFPCA